MIVLSQAQNGLNKITSRLRLQPYALHLTPFRREITKLLSFYDIDY